MNNAKPVYREEDNELLGFIMESEKLWHACTIFGYSFAKAATEDEAKDLVLCDGLSILSGVWHYFDPEDNRWFSCLIKEASEDKVVVIRVNEYGMQDPAIYKIIHLNNQELSNLRK